MWGTKGTSTGGVDILLMELEEAVVVSSGEGEEI